MKKILIKFLPVMFIAFFYALPVSAATDPWDLFVKIIAPAIAWVGFMTVIFGAAQMGFAFRSDEAEEKRKALLVMISGGLLWSLCWGAINIIQKADVKNPSDIPVNSSGGPVDGADSTEMAKLISDITQWIPYLGFLVMFWGFFELSKAMKSDDAGGKQKALTIIVSGLCLWGIIPLMKWVLWGIPI
ncbi:MAG: hypothetical protein FWE47_02515 [Oscillospiraceae bacterium]|nr:hypothetical protein [Oscillospiraceae bacterium]